MTPQELQYLCDNAAAAVRVIDLYKHFIAEEKKLEDLRRPFNAHDKSLDFTDGAAYIVNLGCNTPPTKEDALMLERYFCDVLDSQQIKSIKRGIGRAIIAHEVSIELCKSIMGAYFELSPER